MGRSKIAADSFTYVPDSIFNGNFSLEEIGLYCSLLSLNYDKKDFSLDDLTELSLEDDIEVILALLMLLMSKGLVHPTSGHSWILSLKPLKDVGYYSLDKDEYMVMSEIVKHVIPWSINKFFFYKDVVDSVSSIMGKKKFDKVLVDLENKGLVFNAGDKFTIMVNIPLIERMAVIETNMSKI